MELKVIHSHIAFADAPKAATCYVEEEDAKLWGKLVVDPGTGTVRFQTLTSFEQDQSLEVANGENR